MTFETFDRGVEETWPDQQNRQWKRQRHWQRQRQRQIHLENTPKERPQRLVTFETFDQSNEETWPDQQNSISKTKTMTKTFGEDPERATQETCDHWDICKSECRHDMTFPKQTMTTTITIREHPQRPIQETFDLWDIWSGWWRDITWLTKRLWQRQWQWQWQWQWQLQRPLRETCDLWDTDYMSDNWEQQSQHS